MPDWIRLTQRLIGKLTGHRELFAFTPLLYRHEAPEPNPLRDRQIALGQRFGVRLFSRAYPGIPGRIHIHDSMLQSDAPDELLHYAAVGESALRNIRESLAAAGRSFGEIGSGLDMACGFGRVLRLLAAEIDPRRITAADIEEEAVRFVAAEFGVTPVFSRHDFRQVRFNRTFDLIWVGSLFTHLDPPIGLDLLDMLFGLLNPRGVLIFSTQGEKCVENLGLYGWIFPPQEAMFRAGLATTGYAYAPYYPKLDPTYGITIYRREALEAILAGQFGPQSRLVRFAERGWDNHQDVYAYQKQ